MRFIRFRYSKINKNQKCGYELFIFLPFVSGNINILYKTPHKETKANIHIQLSIPIIGYNIGKYFDNKNNVIPIWAMLIVAQIERIWKNKFSYNQKNKIVYHLIYTFDGSTSAINIIPIDVSPSANENTAKDKLVTGSHSNAVILKPCLNKYIYIPIENNPTVPPPVEIAIIVLRLNRSAMNNET